MENLFSPNPEILDIEKQSSKVIIKYSHLGEMFPMLPQGFYFLKNVFDRLCKTSGKLEKDSISPSTLRFPGKFEARQAPGPWGGARRASGPGVGPQAPLGRGD